MRISNLPNRLIQYLKEVRIEAKKVNWPTRKEALRYTLIVIGIFVSVAIFLGTLDYIFTLILNKVILK
ncbi:MAG: preprotein translocase subunit SecE [Candidatus Pacebacteria bacterium]|nr:preprotein translocase subunit SecE [Candidatus Paceibacterota bacterium]